jgi:integrase
MRLKLPKYIHGFSDRHGKARFYFRRPGFKKVPLPGLPWSPEFMAAYQEALAGQRLPVNLGRVMPGTLRALAVLYYSSLAFRSLKPITQSTYRNIIDKFCRETNAAGELNGDKRFATMKREHVVKFMAARADKPDGANGLRKVLRALMRHAVEMGLRADDPTHDVRAIRVKTDGYHSWTDEEIARFETCHAVGTLARLALALLLYTGQRRGDVVRMGRQHVRDGVLAIRQQKTGTELSVPLHPELQAIIAATAAGQLTFLIAERGKPFTAAGFGNWFREQCDIADLHHCSAHGLRKAAARRLAEAGCSTHEIAAITGHASLREISRYTRAVDQRRLAVAAIRKTRTDVG